MTDREKYLVTFGFLKGLVLRLESIIEARGPLMIEKQSIQQVISDINSFRNEMEGPGNEKNKKG